MNQYGPEFQITNTQQFFAHKLAVLERDIAEIREVQRRGPPLVQLRPPSWLPNTTGQPAYPLGPDRQQWPFRPLFPNIQHTSIAQPVLRRVRNASRNLNPCHACQLRKKKCKRLDNSPNLCERCEEWGHKECHPAPRPSTQGHATEEHNVKNLDYASTFAHTARGPTSASSAEDVSREGENAGHMVHDGIGNLQGFSCAATYDRIKKENTGWDMGVLIPPA